MVIVSFLWFSPLSKAQTASSFTPDTPFTIPSGNGTIFFAENGIYNQAELENNTWLFTDLRLTDSPEVPSFRVSTQNCNITITSFVGVVNDPHSGALHYNVTGSGTQTFNFDLSPAFSQNPKGHVVIVRLNLTQYPDFHPEGDGWTFADDGTITVTGATDEVYLFFRDYSSELPNENLPYYQSHPVLIASLVSVVAIVIVGAVLKFRSIRFGGRP